MQVNRHYRKEFFSAVAQRFAGRPEHVMFVAGAPCEFDPVKILKDFYRERPPNSRAIPQCAARNGAPV